LHTLAHAELVEAWVEAAILVFLGRFILRPWSGSGGSESAASTFSTYSFRITTLAAVVTRAPLARPPQVSPGFRFPEPVSCARAHASFNVEPTFVRFPSAAGSHAFLNGRSACAHREGVPGVLRLMPEPQNARSLFLHPQSRQSFGHSTTVPCILFNPHASTSRRIPVRKQQMFARDATILYRSGQSATIMCPKNLRSPPIARSGDAWKAVSAASEPVALRSSRAPRQ
jgi:hypothetical protein